jgi:hypothetical protein
VAAVNANGQPVVAAVNYNGSNETLTFQLNHLPLSGNVTAQVYLADHGSNQAQSPLETLGLNVTNGSVTFSIPMTAYSMAGAVLN